MVKRTVEIEVKTTGEQSVNKLERSVESLNSDISKTTKVSQGVSNALNKNSKGMGNFSRASGQAGIQLQQFIGQVQGGQSAMLALSQQSADLGFVLGAPLLGAVVGISASIAGILLPNLFKANESIKELDETTEGLIKTFDDLSKEQQKILLQGLQQQLKDQVKQFSELNEEVQDLERTYNNSKFLSGDQSGFGDGLLASIFGGDPDEANKDLITAKNSLVALNQEIISTANKINNLGAQETEEQAVVNKLIESLKVQADIYGASDRAIALYTASVNGATIAQINDISSIFDRIDALKQQEELQKEQDLSEKERAKEREERKQREIDLEKQLNDEQIRINQNVANSEKQLESIRVQTLGNSLGALSSFVKNGSKLQKAFFLGQKAVLAAEALNNSRAGAALALSTLPPPLGESVAAERLAFGKINAGLILAQGIGSISGGGGSSSSTGGSSTSAGFSTPTETEASIVPTVENTAITELTNELRNRDPDEPLTVDFTRRIIAAIDETQSSGQA